MNTPNTMSIYTENEILDKNKDQILRYIISEIGEDYNCIKVYFSEEKSDCICILLTDNEGYLYTFEGIFDFETGEIKDMSIEKKG